MRIISHQIENINNERETNEKNQIEILELKCNNRNTKITSSKYKIHVTRRDSVIL